MTDSRPSEHGDERYPVHGHGAYAVIELNGSLTSATRRDIDRAVGHALRHAGNVLVDMSAVTHVDPVGWAALVHACDRVQPTGSFALFGARAEPQHAFDALDQKALFNSFPSLEEALIALVLHPNPSHDRRAAILLGYIERSQAETFTSRELLRRVSRHVFPTATSLQATLDLLEERGHIRRLPDLPVRRPGRPPSPRYVVQARRAPG